MANGHGGKRANAGRKVGQTNESTRIAKEAIEMVFDKLGGVEAMARWATNNPDDFYRLIFPKLLPVQMQHSGAIEHEIRQIDRRIRHIGDRDGGDIRAAPPSLPI